jgi:ketol-acid reductoisomerase
MPAFYYDSDADLSIVRNKKVAFVGYGNQGMWTKLVAWIIPTTY